MNCDEDVRRCGPGHAREGWDPWLSPRETTLAEIEMDASLRWHDCECWAGGVASRDVGVFSTGSNRADGVCGMSEAPNEKGGAVAGTAPSLFPGGTDQRE